MRRTVHQPCEVEAQRVSHDGQVPRVPERLAPKVHRDPCGQEEAADGDQQQVQSKVGLPGYTNLQIPFYNLCVLFELGLNKTYFLRFDIFVLITYTV